MIDTPRVEALLVKHDQQAALLVRAPGQQQPEILDLLAEVFKQTSEIIDLAKTLEREATAAVQYGNRLDRVVEEVLRRANGQTPELVYVGKDYTLGELHHALLAALHDPMGPPT